MAYLATFYWGWLLGSVLLGLAMGWISVVQHGDGVPKKWRWALAAFAAALVAAALTPGVPRRFRHRVPPPPRLFVLFVFGVPGRLLVRESGGLPRHPGGLQ